MKRILGLLAALATVAVIEGDYLIAAGQGGGIQPVDARGAPATTPIPAVPALAAPRIREALKMKNRDCNDRGKQYAVVRWDGTVDCAQLVPGYDNPYLNERDRQALAQHLRNLKMKP